jgi:hypothetical protein
MVLDQTREVVLSWFEGRNFDHIDVMIEVLTAKGFVVDIVDLPGKRGGVRRILALVPKDGGEGHAVVMDDDESIVDPRSRATTKKTLLDYAGTGFSVERVFIITKKD